MFHAACWVDPRGKLIETQGSEPRRRQRVPEYFGALYGPEESILVGECGNIIRAQLERVFPVIDELIEWIVQGLADLTLLRTSPFLKPASHTMERKDSLCVSPLHHQFNQYRWFETETLSLVSLCIVPLDAGLPVSSS